MVIANSSNNPNNTLICDKSRFFVAKIRELLPNEQPKSAKLSHSKGVTLISVQF